MVDLPTAAAAAAAAGSAPAFQPPVPAPPASADPGGPPRTELGKPIEPAAPGAQPSDPAKPAGDEPPPVDGPKEPSPSIDLLPERLKLPDGMKIDDPLFKDFTATLTDNKIDPQTRGQALIDLYAKGVKTIQDAQTEAWTKVNDSWAKEVKADPEIGGAKFDATKTTIAKAIDSLGPELSVAFRQGLDATGAGNHPAIWKGLAKMAALLTEGGHVSGTPPKSGKTSVKDAFYPNSPDMK